MKKTSLLSNKNLLSSSAENHPFYSSESRLDVSVRQLYKERASKCLCKCVDWPLRSRFNVKDNIHCIGKSSFLRPYFFNLTFGASLCIFMGTSGLAFYTTDSQYSLNTFGLNFWKFLKYFRRRRSARNSQKAWNSGRRVLKNGDSWVAFIVHVRLLLKVKHFHHRVEFNSNWKKL